MSRTSRKACSGPISSSGWSSPFSTAFDFNNSSNISVYAFLLLFLGIPEMFAVVIEMIAIFTSLHRNKMSEFDVFLTSAGFGWESLPR